MLVSRGGGWPTWTPALKSLVFGHRNQGELDSTPGHLLALWPWEGFLPQGFSFFIQMRTEQHPSLGWSEYYLVRCQVENAGRVLPLHH